MEDPVEAGSGELTLTCTVHEVITGLTNMPSAQWEGPSGTVSSGDDITVTEVLRNATTTTLTLTLSPPHTSHAGEYTCQGMVDTPAPEGPVTPSSSPTTVTVSSKWPHVCGLCYSVYYLHFFLILSSLSSLLFSASLFLLPQSPFFLLPPSLT